MWFLVVEVFLAHLGTPLLGLAGVYSQQSAALVVRTRTGGIARQGQAACLACLRGHSGCPAGQARADCEGAEAGGAQIC